MSEGSLLAGEGLGFGDGAGGISNSPFKRHFLTPQATNPIPAAPKINK